jgi:amino acid transporter
MTIRCSPVEHSAGERRTRYDRKPMTLWDGFIYNFLAMGVIFPWVYVWGPAAFPGGNIPVGLALAFVVQLPICLTYVYLSKLDPRDGGDYRFQSRALGRFGAIVVMSGFVVWILQWIALAGWLFASLGLAPLFLFVGVTRGQPKLTFLATMIESPGGVVLITLVITWMAIALLRRGLRTYALLQRMLFALTVTATVAMIGIFLQTPNVIHHQIDLFVSILVKQLSIDIPINAARGFSMLVPWDAYNHGFRVDAPASWWSTLAIIPIAWTSLQWSTYSVEQNGQIAGSDRTRNQMMMMVGSAAAVAGMLIVIALTEERALGGPLLRAFAGSYWSSSQMASPNVLHLLRNILQPFPCILAMSATSKLAIGLLIALGFMANAFQITCNCFIGVSRLLIAMRDSGDVRIPNSWIESDAEGTKQIYWPYFISAIPVILGYSLIPSWTNYTLGVTFACGYVFVFSTLSAAKTLFARKRGAERFSVRRKVLRGIVLSAVLFTTLMVGSYLFIPQLGLQSRWAFGVVAVVILLSCGVVYLSHYKSRAAVIAPTERDDVKPFPQQQ